MPITKMIRTCPKCADYYADSSLEFCLVDGTPLLNVDPQSKGWNKGKRIIEEKGKAFRKQQRTRKWRRVLLCAMTMLMVVVVASMVVFNSLIYLTVMPEKTAPAEPSIPNPAATPITVKTDAPTPDTTPVETPICSDADKSRERAIILKRFGAAWRRGIEGERRRIIAENTPARAASDANRGRRSVPNRSELLALVHGNIEGGPGQILNDNLPPRGASVEASLDAIEYTNTFSEKCMSAVVTARYVWRVKTNVNGTIRVVRVEKGKKFTCGKVEGVWHCR